MSIKKSTYFCYICMYLNYNDGHCLSGFRKYKPIGNQKTYLNK